jgi:hypothetical protein
MEAYNTFTYPVFEADQVLSQKELNMLVSHLEEQDRITRKSLTGIGIVCGLELTFPTTTSAHISCGTAVTSLGFQINWKEKLFTHYQDYDLSNQFLKPDYTREPYLETIFKYAPNYLPIKNSYELLPSDSQVVNKKNIPNDFFDNHVVLLLLEVTLIDQKNCVTTNCDDKGKRMEFNIKPLVIPIDELTQKLVFEYPIPQWYKKLSFPRYNVPFKNITTAVQVLEGFAKAYDDTYLTGIATAIQTVYESHKNNLPTTLTVLGNSKSTILNAINTYKTTVSVQYLWDWIADIVATYNEIVSFRKINPALCCFDESLFPFHVVLGGDTTESLAYRTPFFATLNEKQKEDAQLKKLVLLFEKLALIISSFNIEKGIKIKVTPSAYGNIPLSEKTIPFYYNQILELNKKWNPELTVKKQNDTILSYYSSLTNYTNKPEVVSPLLFDIEPYNFFRVEGHIGMNYKNALKDLNLIRDSYGLPFKITALNAVDFINKEVDIMKFDGRWDDLETDYDLARKRVYNITEYVINWMDLKKTALVSSTILTIQNINSFKTILAELKNLLTNDLKAFLPNYKSFYEIFKELNLVFLFHRRCIELLNPTVLSIIEEDFIDRLDDVNELFLDDPFTVIYEEANIRWQKLYKDLFFSTFLKKHPGLEHKAGVTKGGTFVVVYVDTSIFKATAPPLVYTNLLNSIKNYSNSINIPTSVKQDLTNSIKLTSYTSQLIVKPLTTAIDKCKAETDNIKANLLDIAKYNLNANYSAEISGYILENLNNVLQYEVNLNPQANNFQQMIIADFFLPYSCCGDGNTIEVKIEVNEPLSISLDRLKYCNNDKEEYEIRIRGKSGGIFSGTAKGAVIQKSDKYYLKPNHASVQAPKMYSLQYELNGELSNTIEFEILTPTVLSWTAQRDVVDVAKFIFTNPTANDKHEYEINFGDNNTPILTTDKNTVSHSFSFNEIVKQFTVTIKQLGEVCINTQTLVVKAIGDFNASDFNSKDFYTEK